MTNAATPIDPDDIPEDCRAVVTAICEVGRRLSRLIARGAMGQDLGVQVGRNSGGDGQKALDVMADEAFAAAARGAGVRYYGSEERETVTELDETGTLALAIDPLDGSSNIDVNVSIGTIFSIYPAAADGMTSLLRKASEQIAAGYIIYGPQTSLVITFGAGTRLYTLDPESQRFMLISARLRIPDKSPEYAINASNYRHWSAPVRAYIDDCLAGEDGPHSRNYNMRWIASLVAETHRILIRGGLFLYPADARPGYQRGRLRMVYESAPIAMLIEQAGGGATDGHTSILDQSARGLHDRTPLVFGSKEKVDRVTAYHDLPPAEASALFGQRGLFRA
ncbi:class 1 fructose-bisphosphatase [Tropicimonas sp.]|uniref:class 1 fructose-bisphosphatase n=1 Tax=Tropicimonas sp. TaxID=2067044 RepID=UPI003A8713BB